MVEKIVKKREEKIEKNIQKAVDNYEKEVKGKVKREDVKRWWRWFALFVNKHASWYSIELDETWTIVVLEFDPAKQAKFD